MLQLEMKLQRRVVLNLYNVTIYGNEKILFNILKNLSARFNDIILQTTNEQILNNHQNTCYAIVNFA